MQKQKRHHPVVDNLYWCQWCCAYKDRSEFTPRRLGGPAREQICIKCWMEPRYFRYDHDDVRVLINGKCQFCVESGKVADSCNTTNAWSIMLYRHAYRRYKTRHRDYYDWQYERGTGIGARCGECERIRWSDPDELKDLKEYWQAKKEEKEFLSFGEEKQRAIRRFRRFWWRLVGNYEDDDYPSWDSLKTGADLMLAMEEMRGTLKEFKKWRKANEPSNPHV